MELPIDIDTLVTNINFSIYFDPVSSLNVSAFIERARVFAEENNPIALNNYAFCLKSYNDNNNNNNLIKELLEKSISLGNINASLNLFDILPNKTVLQLLINIIKEDNDGQLMLFQNTSLILFHLGTIYRDGLRGIKKDIEGAKLFYQVSANYGNPDALHALGELFENDSDYENALKYYKKSQDLGNEDAELSFIYAEFDYSESKKAHFVEQPDIF
jgi:TPR repeat protein